MQGLINVYKPQDFTSHDCVAIIRRVSGIKKTGHTGTLDPMATGVLPVCVGKATRIIQYLDKDIKEYKCTMRLGLTSDTQDIWGQVIETGHADGIGKDDIIKILKSFEGDIMQTPPKYSAIKVKGRKLYEYARAGKDVEIKPRKVTIDSITDIRKDGEDVSFTVSCHKGTYIRAICHDAGRMLGCGAVMTALERSASGMFKVGSAIDIRDIKEMTKEDISGLLTPMEDAIDFQRITVDKNTARDLINGKRISSDGYDIVFPEDNSDNRIAVFSEDTFIGICNTKNDIIIPDKIFNTELARS